MTVKKVLVLTAVLVGLSAGFGAAAPEGRCCFDGHGGKVYFPQGDISFADEVASYILEDLAPSDSGDAVAAESLDIPDYSGDTDDKYLCLGCGGTLTLKFVDNVLTDVDGPDLYVLEIGGAVEPISLSLSRDGTNWTAVGEISGGKAEVKFSCYAEPEEVFYYVRLEDLRTACGEGTPGADIDAVGAIGSAIRLSMESSVLFRVR